MSKKMPITPSTSGGTTSVYSGGLLVSSWEIDFFGRVASLKDAALAQYLASEEAQRSAQTSLIASVASTWLSLRTDEALLALTQRTLATREDSMAIIRAVTGLGRSLGITTTA